jgi:hypothetical protein
MSHMFRNILFGCITGFVMNWKLCWFKNSEEMHLFSYNHWVKLESEIILEPVV